MQNRLKEIISVSRLSKMTPEDHANVSDLRDEAYVDAICGVYNGLQNNRLIRDHISDVILWIDTVTKCL